MTCLKRYDDSCRRRQRLIRELEWRYRRSDRKRSSCLIVINKEIAHTLSRQKCIILDKQYHWNDQRKLWSSINTLVDQKPTYLKTADFGQNFYMTFFGKKTTNVRKDTEGTKSLSSSLSPSSAFVGFTPVTVDKIKMLISHRWYANKAVGSWSMADLAHGRLCRWHFTVHREINQHFDGQWLRTSEIEGSQHHSRYKQTATWPGWYKLATYVQRLGRLNAPAENCMLTLLVTYREENNLMPPNQSAYNRSHSTETALTPMLLRHH